MELRGAIAVQPGFEACKQDQRAATRPFSLIIFFICVEYGGAGTFTFLTASANVPYQLCLLPIAVWAQPPGSLSCSVFVTF